MTRFYIICIIIAFIIFFVSTNPNWIGKKGESIVTNKLHSLPRSRYYVLNDVLLKNNNFTSQIDHVVISPYGVFVIETKNYKGWITGRQYSDEWTQHLRGQKNNFRNPIRQGRYILFPNRIEESREENTDKEKRYRYFSKTIDPIKKNDDCIAGRIIVSSRHKKDILHQLQIMGISKDILFGDNVDIVCEGIVSSCMHRVKGDEKYSRLFGE